MYALITIDESLIRSQADHDRIQKHLKYGGVTQVHEHSFLIDLVKASFALADLQTMARNKSRPFESLAYKTVREKKPAQLKTAKWRPESCGKSAAWWSIQKASSKVWENQKSQGL